MTINRFSTRINGLGCKAQFEIRLIESISKQTLENRSSLIFHPAYSIIWILEGSGELKIDLDTFKMESGTVCFVKPSQAFELEISENTSGFIICFVKEFIELYEKTYSELTNIMLFNHILAIPVIKLKNEVSFLKNIAAQMVQEFKSYFDLRVEVISGFLKIFIIYLIRQFDDINMYNLYSRKAELVNNFYTQLEEKFLTKKMPRDYADMLNVTPSYLNEIVKEISGYTVSHHIKQRIILEAKRKAIFFGHNMKEIAYCLGFMDPAHFSKYFKKSCGENFTNFKKGIACFTSSE